MDADIPALSLYDEIITIFVERLHLAVPSLEADLLTSGVLDSLALVELLLQIEMRYGVHIALDALEFDDFRSVASIAAFVARERQSVMVQDAA